MLPQILSSMKVDEKTTYKEWTITRKGSLFYTLSHEKFPSTLFNLTADAVLDKIVSNDLTTEDSEILELNLFKDSSRSLKAGEGTEITINDTSQYENNGSSIFLISSGTTSIGETLSITEDTSDPDGNGTSSLSYSWHSSSDEIIWQVINHHFCSFKAKVAKEKTF